MKSIWIDSAVMPQFPKLCDDINTDVLIIGGGMAGILCAYSLHQKGVKYILVEKKTIGCGITKNTTAVITAQHDTLYSDLVKQFGENIAKKYLLANLDAVEKFRVLSRKFYCDFEDKPSIIYSQTNKNKMEKEICTLNKLGFDAEFLNDITLPVTIAGAVKFPNMAQFNPMMFLSEISRGLNIYEHTFVEKLHGTTAYIKDAKINAKKVIITTHFPFINSHGLYFAKLYQKRSYVIAIENDLNIKGTYVDYAKNGLYFRNYKDLLLIGGGDHRTGNKGGNFSVLRHFAKQHFPKSKEKYAWATQDCMSLDGVPYIGQYSKNMPNVYVATGFNEWGMTSSMVSANILTDMVMGIKNEYEEVFSPQRSMLNTQLLINFGASTIDYVFPTTKRCSHLGCALKWNNIEHTWDCSCHGSRFNKSGNVIDNPAMKEINIE